MFENRQLAVFEGKCRRFRNSSECLKTNRASNNLLYIDSQLSKIWSVHTYAMPRTVYFG